MYATYLSKNMTDYRKRVVESALKYVGTTEPRGDDKFITAYNKWAGSKFDEDSTPWCAIFVTYNMRMMGVPVTIVPTFAKCSVAIDWFSQRGLYKTRESGYTPQPGDIIFFDWKPGTGVDHVGIVVDVSNGKVNTIEGNTRNSGKGAYGVFKKSYTLTSNLILGYGVPDYEGVGTSTGVSNPAILSGLVKGTYIKKFQEWLNATYGTVLVADGNFNKASKNAAIRCWQKQMNISFKAGLIVDGSFGFLCKAACTKRTLNKGSKATNLVYILQGMLYAHGYDPKGFDGVFGTNCQTAVMAFQKARKIYADGSVGRSTWDSLFNKW